jgi:hypothetical protein
MTAMTLSSLIASASELSIEQQLELNRAVVALIKGRRKVQAVVQGSKFYPTQLVRFNAKSKGMKVIKIEKFNRAGTAVVGYEHDASGRQVSAVRWTVSTNLCTAISASAM